MAGWAPPEACFLGDLLRSEPAAGDLPAGRSLAIGGDRVLWDSRPPHALFGVMGKWPNSRASGSSFSGENLGDCLVP